MRADKSQQVAPAHTCSAAARGTASMGSSSSSSPLLRAGGKVWICCYFLSVIAAPYRFALVCVPALRAPRVSLLAAWKSPLFFSRLIFSRCWSYPSRGVGNAPRSGGAEVWGWWCG